MSSVNDIPNGWTETNLGKLGRVITGKTPSKNNPDDWGDVINFITPSEIDNSSKYIYNTPRKLSKQGFDRFSRMILPFNSVIVTCIGSDMGKVVMNRNQALTNQQINSIVVNDKHDADYVFYLLKNAYKVLRRNAEGSGSTMPILNKSSFESLAFIIPEDIKEQKAIANILTAFDDKIENLQAQNKTLEQTAQTIFKEWFGKYQVGDELPDGWRVGKITELFEIRDGTHDSPKQKKIGYKLITSKHLGNNRIKLEDAYLISEEDYINVNKRSRVEQFDILVSMIGTIGLTYLEQNELINYAIKNVALFKTSQNKTFSIYTYLWLKSSFGKYFFETSKSGTTQEYISLKSFRAIELVIPNDKMIKKFNDIVFNLFRKTKNNTDQTQSLKKTRNTLLPKLMSGQLRINEFKESRMECI